MVTPEWNTSSSSGSRLAVRWIVVNNYFLLPIYRSASCQKGSIRRAAIVQDELPQLPEDLGSWRHAIDAQNISRSVNRRTRAVQDLSKLSASYI
jgi:hypothetical protein